MQKKKDNNEWNGRFVSVQRHAENFFVDRSSLRVGLLLNSHNAVALFVSIDLSSQWSKKQEQDRVVKQ